MPPARLDASLCDPALCDPALTHMSPAPLPIHHGVQVNEDDAGMLGMCFACGQTTCGECRRELERTSTDCPTCRAPFQVSEIEMVCRLTRLLDTREPGRHTQRAYTSLGSMYYRGTGVEQSFSDAAHWYQLAAENGDASAQSSLGVMYFNGYGVVQDYGMAEAMFRLGAAQDHPPAQCHLGVMADQGKVCQSDWLPLLHSPTSPRASSSRSLFEF